MRNFPHEMDTLLARLFPICRSITGNGVRETLAVLREYIPLEMTEVPSGTKVLDWTVPQEWNITDAYIKNAHGEKVVDFAQSNLHVMSYSTPVHARMSLTELKEHLHSLPDDPDTIPYRTSYYAPNWGFCLTYNQLKALPDCEYEAVIDSTLTDGSLTYGELLIPGRSKEEVLISTYVCHPSMANDNLSGPVLATFLAQQLREKQASLRYSYRFIFVPETIGAIVWLSRNQETLSRIKHGLVATCCGDGGDFTYKKSRRGDALIDQAAQQALAQSGRPYHIREFYPLGSDERQYCSPGFNLPVGSLMRTPYGDFPEYHSSRDDLTLVKGAHLAQTLELYEKTLDILEKEPRYENTSPYGEPQLGRRGLYSPIGGVRRENQRAMHWLLNWCDGEHLLSDIARRSGLSEDALRETVTILKEKGLVRETP